MTGKHERNLARFMDQAGVAVMRSPASGGAGAGGDEAPGPGEGRPQPDLLIGQLGRGAFAAELKSGDGPHYFTADEVDALKWFARCFDAHTVLVSRFSGDSAFRFWNPDGLHRTDSGSYRAKPGDDPVTVLADPSSSADSPPGHQPDAVARHGLGRILAEGLDGDSDD